MSAEARPRILAIGQTRDSPAPREQSKIQELSRRIQMLERRLRNHDARARLARLDERRAISRHLHDQLGQILIGLKFEVHRHSSDNGAEATEPAAETAVLEFADRALVLVRTLAVELRHPDPAPVDVSAMLEALFHDFTQRWRLRGRFVASGGQIRIAGDRASLVADVIREALTNVVRHTEATTVTLTLERSGPRAFVRLDDNGHGIAEPAAVPESSSLGLLGMRERTEQLGGVLDITSRTRRGTSVVLIFPLRPRAAAGRQNLTHR